MQNETEPLYHSPQVPDVNDGLSSVAGNHKIFDTRNLSQVNFVYNNVTFQVYSNSKITNEKSTYNEMDDRLREKNLSSTIFKINKVITIFTVYIMNCVFNILSFLVEFRPLIYLHINLLFKNRQ